MCQCIHDVIEGRDFFDPYGADAMSMRALFAIGAIEIYFRDEKPSEAVSLIHDLRCVLRDLDGLAEGLSQSPRREHARIHAYDSFIWRA